MSVEGARVVLQNFVILQHYLTDSNRKLEGHCGSTIGQKRIILESD